MYTTLCIDPPAYPILHEYTVKYIRTLLSCKCMTASTSIGYGKHPFIEI